jgi:hypothetical protein
MSFEAEVFQHFADNWTYCTIGWVQENVSFDPTPDEEYAIPAIRHTSARIAEIPVESGLVRNEYLFSVNFLIKENSGMASLEGYVEQLRTLYHKKTIKTASYNVFFGPLNTLNGFYEGAHFEVPTIFNTTVFSQ